MRSTGPIAAALLACLPACGNMATERPALTGEAPQIRQGLALACPRPTTEKQKAAILAELESLDAGARACRGT